MYSYVYIYIYTYMRATASAADPDFVGRSRSCGGFAGPCNGDFLNYWGSVQNYVCSFASVHNTAQHGDFRTEQRVHVLSSIIHGIQAYAMSFTCRWAQQWVIIDSFMLMAKAVGAWPVS